MKATLLIGILVATIHTSAQVNELENFRKEVTVFVNYDTGKSDSLPKSETSTIKLKKNLEEAFLKFVLHKDSRNLDSLKKNAKNQGSSYWFNNYSYTFANESRDIFKKSLENNVNYSIAFYGLYDYNLSNFVSMYIQPFTVAGKAYAVYYYKLNRAGQYYIKDIATNQVVFKSEALTSNAAIAKCNAIDATHFLLVEDMGDNGQRALVVNTTTASWKTTPAFSGKALQQAAAGSTQKAAAGNRTYLRFATNSHITRQYGLNFLLDYVISFDEATATISYKQYNKTGGSATTVKAKWEKGVFKIDDYDLVQAMDIKPVPMGGM